MSVFRDSRGGITLEAAMVFPVFLGFLIFLINLLNAAMIYIAMDHAVSETARQLAAHSYPLRYLQLPWVTTSPSKAGQTLDKMINNPALISTDSGKQILSAMGADVFTEIAGELAHKASGYVLEPVIKKVASRKLREFYPLGGIGEQDYLITELKIFNPNNPDKTNGTVNATALSNEDIAITVKYRVKVAVPFFPLQHIVLSNTAVERAWVDDY